MPYLRRMRFTVASTPFVISASLLLVVCACASSNPNEPALTATPAPAATHASASAAATSARMVNIPGGTFTMGSPDGAGNPQEHPRHRVTVAPFALDLTLVTVGAYRACVGSGACTAAGTEQHGTPFAGPEQNAFCNGPRTDRDDHPINCVEWSQAVAYCNWAGKRLPSEEEWEYAARGPDDRAYPWGADAPSSRVCWSRVTGDDFAHAKGTCPVGAYPAGDSAFGVHDMVGNVWVWTSSVWSPAFDKPLDPSARVVRGGGWRDSNPSEFRSANRNGSDLPDRVINLGFRCAK